MSILLASEIDREVKNGNIVISDYDKKRLGPNSYNLTLSDQLLVYENDELDMSKPNDIMKIQIPKEGIVLQPGQLYLGMTNETTTTSKYVPMLEGRSSIGRLGLSIHVTAGFGDIGFFGKWTLELYVIKPLRIYANTEICQIYYLDTKGDPSMLYKGKYQNSLHPKESKLFEEFLG